MPVQALKSWSATMKSKFPSPNSGDIVSHNGRLYKYLFTLDGQQYWKGVKETVPVDAKALFTL